MTQIINTFTSPGCKPSLCADRFITSRSINTELFNNYDTKSEIFAQASQNTQMDKMGNHSQLLEDTNNENS